MTTGCVNEEGIGIRMDESPQRNARILLTEDSRSDVYLIRTALNEALEGFDLTVLDNGESAMQLVDDFERGAADKPDIVLLDLNLPRCDGKEVLQKLKKMPGGASLPVIVITSSDSPRDREEVMRMGASIYFRKPSDLHEFMQIGKIVKRLLEDPSAGPKHVKPR